MTKKKVVTVTAAGMGTLLPLGVLVGAPYSAIADVFFAVAMPAHGYLGMASVITDYVHDPSDQKIAKALAFGVAVVTGVGLLKLTFTDVGVTGAARLLWSPRKDTEEVHE